MIRKGYAAKIPFSPAEAQEAGLLAEDAKLPVYVEGRGGESLETCLMTFRAHPGELVVFGGLRVFGGSRDKIMSALRNLKARKIIVVDAMNKERSDTHGPEMLDRALRQILGSSKLKGSRKRARTIGAKGGEAKGKRAACKRAEIANPNVIRRICQHQKLSWRDRAAILGMSAATLRRNY
jgi:hypothetical protein